MLLLEGLQITPFDGIQKVHQVEKLPHIVVQRCLQDIEIIMLKHKARTYSRHYYPVDAAQLIELSE